MTNIGERIKHLREAKGLLQKELADKLHVSPDAISQWETGLRTKNLEKISKIAHALGVTEVELLGTDASEVAFLAQLGFTPDDLTGFTEEQRQAMRSALASLMTTFREQNANARMTTTEKKTASIFIIDDDIKLCHLLAKAFRLHGYQTMYAFDGQSAMQKILAGKTKPALILLDLKMPKMDGAKFLRQLRTLDHGAKIVLMTGYLGQAAEIQANQTVDGVLEKPFKMEEVLQMVNHLVGA